MIRDRGSMKWTAMMLPEHLGLIREWKQEQFYDKKRELTEWELEEIEQTIQRAFKMQKRITLTLWSNNHLQDETGLVTGTDTVKKELLLETDVAIKRIALDEIQDAKMVDVDD
ncbi:MULTISPECIES: YolD-like family protein [unclassified Lysinibacillus]|uniref:YolD-like family protein n=1 Tax=unclassified Lysinibacillus TaxID=2636778 RepID=UPI002012ECC1|nr:MULTISPECIES: YolD-like family protein [unclassified Lysinibacillus]MCL1696836.1 YolD-like family protein [Lysinibacillus sp. BPa_S21]MCL1701491.1 YolD-like family protein [Lysinibacillus sp. Bpr_S20]